MERLINILLYLTPDGKEPFTEWISSIRDRKTKSIIFERIDRIQDGNFGDYKFIDKGVCELRIHWGKGYRIYFARHKATIVLLLCGGDKSSQQRDIQKAKAYWAEYEGRKQ